jgi:rhodanese-related sulfurtransferase
MSEAIRISQEETRQKVLAGKALLVCAYADDAKFSQYHLADAIPLSALKAQIGGLSLDQEIIFYCN